MAFYSGFGGRIELRKEGVSTQMSAGRWSVRETVELVDITSGSDYLSGTRNYLPGWRDYEISFDGFVDSEQIITNSQFSNYLRAGLNCELLLVIKKGPAVHLGNELFWYFPCFLVVDLAMDMEIRNICKYTISGKQQGGFKHHLPSYFRTLYTYPSARLNGVIAPTRNMSEPDPYVDYDRI